MLKNINKNLNLIFNIVLIIVFFINLYLSFILLDTITIIYTQSYYFYCNFIFLIFVLLLLLILILKYKLKIKLQYILNLIFLILNLIILLILIIIILNIKPEQTLIFDFNIVKINRKWSLKELEYFFFNYLNEKNIELNFNIFNNLISSNKTPEEVLVALEQLKKESEVEQTVSLGYYDYVCNFVNKNMKIIVIGGTLTIVSLGLLYYFGIFDNCFTNSTTIPVVAIAVNETTNNTVVLDSVNDTIINPVSEVLVNETSDILEKLNLILNSNPFLLVDVPVTGLSPEVLSYCSNRKNIEIDSELLNIFQMYKALNIPANMSFMELTRIFQHVNIKNEVSAFAFEVTEALRDAQLASKPLPVEFTNNLISECYTKFDIEVLNNIYAVIKALPATLTTQEVDILRGVGITPLEYYSKYSHLSAAEVCEEIHLMDFELFLGVSSKK